MSESHRCAAGRACKDKILDQATGKREPAQTEKERDLCGRCANQVYNALDRLGSDWGALSAAVGDLLVSGGDKVGGTREAPMPLNASVLALQSTLSQWCEIAVGMVAQGLNIKPRKLQKARGYPPRAAAVVLQAANVLPDNLDRLIEAPAREVIIWNREGTACAAQEMDGIDVALAILRCHWMITNVLGEPNPRKRLSMPCPIMDCGAMTLGIDNGQTDVTCLTCGGHWSEREYNWLALMVISDTKQNQKEKKTMLEWLLAEAKHNLEQSEAKLAKISDFVRLSDDCFAGVDGLALVGILRESFTK